MVQYSLKVQLDEAWQKAWSKDKSMRLCFSTSTTSGGKSYSNVIAYTSLIAPTVTITWEDQYKIAGADTEFNNGATFDASSEIIDVNFGSVTVLEKDWSISTNPDSNAPDGAFVFKNKRLGAAVIYRLIKGEFRPIYISHIGRMPINSTETLTPKNNVYVWFSSDYESGTMIDGFQGQVKEVNMTGKTSAGVRFDSEGNWLNV